MFWYHWEYFAYFSPLWKKRFDKYCITIDYKNKKILFKDDDELDEFYEEYGYDSGDVWNNFRTNPYYPSKTNR